MTSSLLQRLGIALPIIQGPMTGSDTPALAAAVSAAGGLGMLGCGMRSPAAMAEAAAAVRQQTDRPFGMNLFVQATPNPDEATVQAAMERLAPLYAELGLQPQRPTQWCEDFAAQFEALVALRPAVASFTFGILDGRPGGPPARRRLPGGGHRHHRGRGARLGRKWGPMQCAPAAPKPGATGARSWAISRQAR
jgi:NAD(P)H-dependent flavin oxidoreductase YrpB (nitropropane dioxygenase family)